ncbi:MAG: hypothetical protein HY928_02380 [Elusimicrobia bacterium]|nr:hypothetical protein [Elusimicrobiota bacterium]
MSREFLYHVLMAPFAQGEEPIQGVLLLSTLLSAAVFSWFYIVLRSERAPAAWAWTLLLAGSAATFLLRTSFVRPHVLALLIVLAAWRALLRGQVALLAALGFVLSWSYSVPLILPALALVYLAGQGIAGEKPQPRLLAAAAGGVLAGLVVHPYSPNSLDGLATCLQAVRIAALERSLAAVEVGRELAPYSSRGFLQFHGGMTALLGGLALAGWTTRRRLSGQAFGTLAAAWAAFLGTMVFPRFVEYAAPLCVLATALAVRDILEEGGRGALQDWARRNRAAAGAVLLALLLGLGGTALSAAAYTLTLSAGDDPPRFGGAAQWMAANLEPEETVVNLWWDDFPELFYDAPRQNYLVGLDPTYRLRWDAQKALRLEAIRAGRAPIDAAWLAEAFGARVMVLRAPYTRFYPQLDWRLWQPVYADATAAVYALVGPHAPKAQAAEAK